MNKKAYHKSKLASSRKDLLFYCLMLAWPVIQFAIFYVAVNFRSILFSFQNITNTGTELVYEFSFDNIARAFSEMTSLDKLPLIYRSILTWVILTAIQTPLALFFSFYIYKKMPLSSFFRVVLFLPSILSSIIVGVIYTNFMNYALPEFLKVIFGLEGYETGLMTGQGTTTTYWMIILFNVLMGFGTNVLLYANGMNSINEEVMEASMIDGAGPMRQFWHIALPCVYSTLTTFIIAGVGMIFSNQFNAYSLLTNNVDPSIQTFGYFLFVRTTQSTLYGSTTEFPLLSAYGLLLTAISIPLTFLTKYLMEKFGPSEL